MKKVFKVFPEAVDDKERIGGEVGGEEEEKVTEETKKGGERTENTSTEEYDALKTEG